MALLCAAFVADSFARPAAPFAVKSAQSDGSALDVRMLGDEHYHFAVTSDGLLVERGPGGDYFYVGSDGLRSDVRAKDAAFRSAEEADFVAGIDQDEARLQHKARKERVFQKSEQVVDYTYDAGGTLAKRMRPRAESWVIGERYIPVLLLSTPNKAAVDSTRMWRFFNEKGYSEEGNIGSVRDFYLESSNGRFSPHFDIFPITISKNLDQYVDNRDSLREDVLTTESIDLLMKRSDFDVTKYVSNKSKKLVDGIIILFPGREEEALVYSEEYWAHQFWMQANGANNRRWEPYGYSNNGYIFDRYVLVAQLEDADNEVYYRNGYLNKLGIYVHEFAHVLGLMDHYGVNSAGEQELGASAYDLMSSGMYNEYGRVPVKFNAFERETMGWMTLTELTQQDTGVIKLGDIDQGIAYSVTNPSNKDEYFIVEYRPAKGYDAGVINGPDYAYNGVWVWYIYYEAQAWEMNNVNGMDDFNRVDIKTSLVNGLPWAKDSYSPLVYRAGSKSPVPGVFNFVKSGDTLACFTLDASVEVKECGVRPPASSSSVSSSSQSSSSQAESSSSAEVPPSSAMFAAGTQVLPRFALSLEGRHLAVTADVAGAKTVRIFDMQGNEVMRAGFVGASATVDLSALAHGHFAVAVTTDNASLGIRPLQLK